MIAKRFIAIICPLLIALGFELLFYFSVNVPALAALLIALLLILAISLKLLIKEKFLSWNFAGLAILPLFFYLLTANYILILGFGLFRQIIILAAAVFLGLYLENLFLFFYQRSQYQVNSLENSATFLNLLVFFLLALDLNALSVLINPPLWLLSLVLIFVLTASLFQLVWILKIKDKQKSIYILIINLIILEFFWSLSFLPTNFYVSAIILTIFYYFLIGLLRAKLLQELNKKIFWRYVIISIILLLLILLTSRWI